MKKVESDSLRACTFLDRWLGGRPPRWTGRSQAVQGLKQNVAWAVVAVFVLCSAPAAAQEGAQEAPPYGARPAHAGKVIMVMHGGAGGIERGAFSEEREQQYRAKLREALQTGYQVLQEEDGTSVEAVERSIQVLENSPLFNSARGAVFTSERNVELDASIMDGSPNVRTEARAGAVARIQHVKSPIALARLVMEESRHVMLVGDGAETFALTHGMEWVPNDYFQTERRRQQVERVLRRRREASQDDESPGGRPRGSMGRGSGPLMEDRAAPVKEYGTVGAVARDGDGHLAAGTSTGGLTAKRYGRVGDSPIIGAGTYADDATCAVSATGTGEYFMRGVIAHDIASMMRYADRSVEEAARTVILEQLTARGGSGGVIALDAEGNIATPFNTAGMFRGYVTTGGQVVVRLYGPKD